MLRRLRKGIEHTRKALRWTKWYTIIQAAVLVGMLRRHRQIVSCWPELPVTLPPKVVLFMHFDRHGGVRPQLLSYMREFADSGRAVVFITNAGRLKPEAEAALRQICSAIIIRRNRGYDFGAWRDGIEHLGLPRADTTELILVNDSVFGPLRPIGDILEKLDYGIADVWGLTESWQSRYHLQSFFLAFGPAALRSSAFAKFWAAVYPVPAKSYIVKIYEVGITQAMLKGGLRCAAVWKYNALTSLVEGETLERLLAVEVSELGKTDPIHITRRLQVMKVRDCVARRIAMNPTSDLWRQLLLSGFPFIKRELLRDNPTDVQDIGDWINVARDVFGAAPETILADLRLMMKDSAP
jgi:hypothetical protein